MDGKGRTVNSLRQIRCTRPAYALIVLTCSCLGGSLARGDTPTGAAEASLPQQGFFSSLKQATNEDFDREVVRGHFDLGSPPNAHRYYCMVDPKTGKRQSNGVLGKPFAAPGGLTRLRETAVSLYRCVDAEKAGLLITTGYVTGEIAAGPRGPTPEATAQPAVQAQVSTPAQPAAQAQVSTPAQPAAQSQMPPPLPPPTQAAGANASDTVDVAGVKLGMSPDEVRQVLRAKRLPEYHESMESQPVAGGQFVNIIATWMLGEDGESYEVMFTPVPGKERAMAIVHSVSYSAANAVRETTLRNGLVQKYGGFGAPDDLPESPTWRFQGGGKVQVGDPCNRRGIFGALRELNAATGPRKNVALATTLEEFRFQIDQCGTAIVTEDHVAAIVAAGGGAPRQERMITRFTVTAYSPSIAFDGAASAAQRTTAQRPAGAAAPIL